MQRITMKDRHPSIEGPSRNEVIKALAPAQRYKIMTINNNNVWAYERSAGNAYY